MEREKILQDTFDIEDDFLTAAKNDDDIIIIIPKEDEGEL